MMFVRPMTPISVTRQRQQMLYSTQMKPLKEEMLLISPQLTKSPNLKMTTHTPIVVQRQDNRLFNANAIKSAQKQLQGSRIALAEKVDEFTAMKEVEFLKSPQKQRQRTANPLRLRQKLIQETSFRNIALTMLVFDKYRYKKQGKPTKPFQPKFYSPTAYSLTFGFKGKKGRITDLTGLETRPIFRR